MSQPSQVVACPYCGTQFYSHGWGSLHCPGCAQVVVIQPPLNLPKRKPKAVLIGKKGATALGIIACSVAVPLLIAYSVKPDRPALPSSADRPTSPSSSDRPSVDHASSVDERPAIASVEDRDHRTILEYLRDKAPNDKYPVVIRWYPVITHKPKTRIYRLKYQDSEFGRAKDEDFVLGSKGVTMSGYNIRFGVQAAEDLMRMSEEYKKSELQGK